MNTKKFIQILAVSATALITACEEELTSFDCETPITVTSQVSEKTRAGYDNANLPSTFVMDIDQQSVNYNYSLVTMTYDDKTATYNAPDGTLLLWKGPDHSGANIKAMTIPYGLDAIDPTNPMTISVRTDQTTPDSVKASDLLGAKTDDGITINGDAINIEFRHLLSKLYVKYKFTNTLENQNPTINSITLENICVQGGYSYKEMDYVNSSLAYGNIQMFHNSADKAAEAIFYPYTPTSNPILKISFSIGNKTQTLSCPVDLKDNESFAGRKKYTMNVRINGTTIEDSFIIGVKDWTEDNESIEGADDIRILWIGTSIPSDQEGWSTSYPKLIEKETGYKIINNARGGSFIHFEEKCNWNPQNYNILEAYSLSATHDEVDKKYRNVVNTICNGDPIQVEYYLNMFKSYSYETLIIPYINGTLDNCNVIVIDHGFNDRARIAFEACFMRNGAGEGIAWLDNIKDSTDVELPENWHKIYDGQGNVIMEQNDKMSYFYAMDYLIKKIDSVKPNIPIIIGNYFASKTPIFADQNLPGGSYGPYLLKANEAVARIHKLPIVNVYKELGFSTEEMYNLYYTLCPDGYHPGSDPNGALHRDIANIYIEKLEEIFGKISFN